MRVPDLRGRVWLWAAVLAAATAAMLPARERLDKAHVALVLLLVVLFGSAAGGRVIGLSLAGASFLVFNWCFLPPYNTFVIRDPLDWLVLIAFLLTSVVAAQLLYRAQEETRAARARAGEVSRLASVGAETLNVGRAEEALSAIASVIRATTAVERCVVYARHDDGSLHEIGASPARAESGDDTPPPGGESLVAWVATSGSAAYEQRDGTTRLGADRPGPDVVRALESAEILALMLPLRVRDRTVGVLRIARSDGLRLDPARWHFLDAISYYAALGVERARLAAVAEHAGALREADQLKDELLAAVSHDLRTPLTTIKALAHDLASLGDERAEIIEQQADRLNRLVTDMLDLSRLRGGALAVRPELNAVDDLLGALVQQVEPALGRRALLVTLPAEHPVLVGRFDLVHALRALTNLVMNAAQHTPADAPIEVSAALEQSSIAIHVADRGPGISDIAAARMFEPYSRHGASRPAVGGAGIGLSIARGLAEAQGGRVTYAARAGGGSVFTLFLPRAEPPASGGAPSL